MLMVYGSDDDRRDFFESELIPHFNFVSHEDGMDKCFDDYDNHEIVYVMCVNLDAAYGEGRYMLLKLNEFGQHIGDKEYWSYDTMLEDYMDLSD